MSTDIDSVRTTKVQMEEKIWLELKNMNQTQMMMSGTLSSGQHFMFNDPEYNSKFSGLIMGKTPTITPDTKANSIGATTLSGLLFSGYSSLVETDNIYFGKVTRALRRCYCWWNGRRCLCITSIKFRWISRQSIIRRI